MYNYKKLENNKKMRNRDFIWNCLDNVANIAMSGEIDD